MCSVEYLREFINERLTAAAEEIFRVIEKTIVEHQEEIDRQRRLLDISWKPDIKLHRIELLQQHVCKEEEVPVYQQLCILERNFSLDQEDPEPPHIKEEQEELCTSQEDQQLVLKQETDVMMAPSPEERDQNNDQTLYLNDDESVSTAEKESVVSVPNSDHQLLPHISYEAESQDQKGCEHGDSGLTGKSKSQKRHHKSRSHSNDLNNDNLLEIHRNAHTGDQSFSCDTCGKDFKCRSNLYRHIRTHIGEKPYVCKTCGKRYNYTSLLKIHIRTHTDEKPFSCKTCGKAFIKSSDLTVHMRIHTGEKLYFCQTCGKRFSQASSVTTHIRTHTGEKPFSCKICGKDFKRNSELTVHMRTHTGEKPFTCKACGKAFKQTCELSVHMRTHKGENSFTCKTCGKGFVCSSNLVIHRIRFHADEKP